MNKLINNASMLAFAMACSFTFGQGAALSTEVVGYIGDKSFHLQSKMLDARVSPLYGQQSIEQAESVLLHVDCGDLKTVQLMQKPFYDIDLAGEEGALDKLTELLPISSQILGLNLMETGLRDNAFLIIGQFTALNFLVVSDNVVGDVAMPSMANLNALRHFEMVHTKVTDAGLGNLARLKLEKLNAGCNLIKNQGIKTISLISSLVDVDVRACEFDATALPLFFNLPKLKKLNISGNKLERHALEDFLGQAKERGIEVKAEDIL